MDPEQQPPRLSPAEADHESVYALLQRGHELMRSRHHAQAAIVLARAARIEPGKGSILEARAGLTTTAPARPGGRRSRGCSRSIPRPITLRAGAEPRAVGRRRRRRTHLPPRRRAQPPLEPLPRGAGSTRRSGARVGGRGGRPGRGRGRAGSRTGNRAGNRAAAGRLTASQVGGGSAKRASQSSPTIDLASGSRPRSAAVTASCRGIRSSWRCSSSSGPSRSSFAGTSSVAR